jgi:hypothetical protein
MKLTRVLAISACGIVAVLAGCDSGKVAHPNTVPAAGVVTYNGSAVEGATVSLMSAESKGSGWTCAGKTDAAGKFTITTVFAPGTEGKGVPPGDYTAVVTKFEAATSSPAGPSGDMKAYQESYEKKNAEAKAAGQAPASSGPKNLVPLKYAADGTSDLKGIKIEAAGNTNIELKLTD